MKRAIIVLLILVLSLTALAQEAIEVGQTVEAEAAGSDVIYTFSAEADVIYIVSLNSEAFDPEVSVANEAGAAVGRDDDGGGYPNARLVFTAASSGTYSIAVGQSFGGRPSGAFTLKLETMTVTPIEYGQTLTVTPEGDFVNFSFSGAEGDVVNLFAASEDDMRIVVYSANGEEVARDDDSGPETDPYIRRFVLPEAGTYRAQIEPVYRADETVPLTELTITLEQTEAFIIGAEPQTLDTTGIESEKVAFMAEAGKTYALTLTTTDTDIYTYITVNQGGEQVAYFQISGITEVAAQFTARTAGMVEVALQFYTFFGDAPTYTASVVAVE